MLQRTKNIDASVYKPSAKKYFDFHDSDLYWPTLIKDTIQWFPFLTIIEHTTNIIKPNKGLINSLLKVSTMFKLRLFYDKYNEEGKVEDAIAIKCSNCNKAAGLHLKDITIEEMITKFVLYESLNYVGMSWIISSNN